MLDFKRIISVCENISRISESLVDNFLLYYIGEKEGRSKRIGHQLLGFKHILSKMEESWIRMIVSQLLAYDLFKSSGYTSKILYHADVKKRSPEDLDYLKFQIEYPWRYAFCSIEKYCLHDMYEMRDVLSQETFLLYSPGISQTNIEAGYELPLWFLLIGYNGECYQTYGPLMYFKGIQSCDLFYFAKQLKPDMVFQDEIQAVIDSNPIPFIMLFYAGASVPATYHKKDILIFHRSEFHVKELIVEKYEKDFIIEKKHPIYMLSLKRWHTFPHFAKCYYHAKKKLFILTSMTTRGYDSLIATLNKQGTEFPANPEILATPLMIHLANQILNINVEMFPYEKHFKKETSPENKQELGKINVFVKSLVDKLNNKMDYDIAELATKADIPMELAEQVAENLIKKISEMPRK